MSPIVGLKYLRHRPSLQLLVCGDGSGLLTAIARSPIFFGNSLIVAFLSESGARMLRTSAVCVVSIWRHPNTYSLDAPLSNQFFRGSRAAGVPSRADRLRLSSRPCPLFVPHREEDLTGSCYHWRTQSSCTRSGCSAALLSLMMRLFPRSSLWHFSSIACAELSRPLFV